jgi:hypothetical protein
MKVCLGCGQEKSESEFLLTPRGKLKRNCTSCCKDADRRIYERKLATSAKAQAPTRSEAEELLDYDRATGVFTWKVSRGLASAGRLAGWVNECGYRVIFINSKGYKAHRLAWLFVHGAWPVYTINHINGMKDDNRICNLEDIPLGENTKHAFRVGLKNIDHLKRYWSERRNTSQMDGGKQ